MSFFQKDRKLGMSFLQAIIFVSMVSVMRGFSLATAAGFPRRKSCPAGCTPLSARWLTVSLTATGWLFEKNTKHQRFRIWDKKLNAERSCEFSSLQILKVGAVVLLCGTCSELCRLFWLNCHVFFKIFSCNISPLRKVRALVSCISHSNE